MTRLSDTQAIILSAAAARLDGNVLPLPSSLRGGAAGKVVTALLSRRLIRERALKSGAPVEVPPSAIWRSDEEGRPVLLEITPAGRQLTGAEAAAEATSAPQAAEDAPPAAEASAAAPAAPESHSRAPRKSREGSKQALLIARLRRPEGATIAQAVEATGWQPHTVRGALAGALKKRLGLAVASEKIDGVRVYRIAD